MHLVHAAAALHVTSGGTSVIVLRATNKRLLTSADGTFVSGRFLNRPFSPGKLLLELFGNALPEVGK